MLEQWQAYVSLYLSEVSMDVVYRYFGFHVKTRAHI